MNKIDKPLTRLIKEKEREHKQSKKWKRKNHTDITEIQYVREFYKQLKANKLDNLKEKDKFL